MFLVDIHELDVILAQPRCGAGFEEQVDDIRRVLSLDGKGVVVSSGTKDLCKRTQVDSERNIAVAAEGIEGFGFEHHGDKGDVRVVHGLERDARVIAVEVAVLYEVLDGVDDLLLSEELLLRFLRERTFLRIEAWASFASSTAHG